MGRFTKLATVAIVAAVGAMGTTGTASAGEQIPDVDLEVDVSVRGPEAATVADGLSVEVYEMPGGTVQLTGLGCNDPAPTSAHPFLADIADITCALPGEFSLAQDYAIGIAGAPAGWAVSASCQSTEFSERITSGVPEFSVSPATYLVNCFVSVQTSVLLVDKIVVGGPSSSADFDLEVFDSGGVVVAEGSDPDNATCELDHDPTKCLVLALPNADGYVMGEVPVDYGYEVTDVTCDYTFIGGDQIALNEAIDLPGATFDHDDGDHYCAVTNTYREGQLIVTSTVTNDEGGTASPTDVSIEVFRTDGTEVVAATACAADGSCLDMMLPIGDYVIGYIGPAGYTREVTQVVQAPTEQITDDPDAEFTIAQFDIVEINVAIDDPTPPTTTTTTTTTTTIAPTTTALGAGAGTLPATGTSSTANGWMAAIALLLLGAGSVLLMARRRPV